MEKIDKLKEAANKYYTGTQSMTDMFVGGYTIRNEEVCDIIKQELLIAKELVQYTNVTTKIEQYNFLISKLTDLLKTLKGE